MCAFGDKKLSYGCNLILFIETPYLGEISCPLYTMKQPASLWDSSPSSLLQTAAPHGCHPSNWHITPPHLSKFSVMARGLSERKKGWRCPASLNMAGPLWPAWLKLSLELLPLHVLISPHFFWVWWMQPCSSLPSSILLHGSSFSLVA